MATLSKQPTDILKLVSSMAGISELGALQATSRDLRQSLKNSRLADQKLQWGALFPNQLAEDFDENERIIREFGISTLDLTAGEKEALILARASLASPPSKLTEEQRAELIQRWLPRYSAASAQDLSEWTPLREDNFGSHEEYEAACASDPKEQAHRYYLEMLLALYDQVEMWADQELANNPNFSTVEPIALTHLALLESSLEGFLRIFVLDGDRLQTSVYRQAVTSENGRLLLFWGAEKELERILSLQISTPVLFQKIVRQWLLGPNSSSDSRSLSRRALQALIVHQIPDPAGCVGDELTQLHPLLVQIHSLIGNNFVDSTGRRTPYWISRVMMATRYGFLVGRTVTEIVRSLDLILDRILERKQLKMLRSGAAFRGLQDSLRYEPITDPNAVEVIQGVKKCLLRRGVLNRS